MEKSSTTFVGLDVHKKDIFVCVLDAKGGELGSWQCENRKPSVQRMAKKLKKLAKGSLECVYEAGPGGFALQRQLREEKVETIVVAPSLIPVKPGERIKTDRRDARKLAELSRAGLLTEVHPPTPEVEAVRDLCRCRTTTKRDQLRARQRLVKWLFRRAVVYHDGSTWTKQHRNWLQTLQFDDPVDTFTFDSLLSAIDMVELRLEALDRKIEAISLEEPYAKPAAWLRCFKGIETTTAMVIVSELHGFDRFQHPRQLMAYIGLTPSEHSSGGKEHRGGITKSGNAHVRRVLIEAAWHYRHRPSNTAALRKRREGQPTAVCLLADRANRRLYSRFRILVDGKNKPAPKAATAIARELVGFVWAVLYPNAVSSRDQLT